MPTPDMTWRYVVEKPGHSNPGADPQGQWVYTDTFDNYDEAVRAATSITGPVRVRSFKVQHMPTEYGIDSNYQTTKPISGDEVPLIEVQCIDHPDQSARIMQGSRAPRCPQCRTAMTNAKFAEKVRQFDVQEPTRD